MPKCFLLGAGFSNQVAVLPLTKDLLQSFVTIYEKEQNSGHWELVQKGDGIRKFLNDLERQLIGPIRRSDVQPNKPGWRIWSIWYKDIEGLLTFID